MYRYHLAKEENQQIGNMPGSFQCIPERKGARTFPSNYRPISITNIVCKTLEYIIHSNLMDHLESHNILTINMGSINVDPVRPNHSSCRRPCELPQ